MKRTNQKEAKNQVVYPTPWIWVYSIYTYIVTATFLREFYIIPKSIKPASPPPHPSNIKVKYIIYLLILIYQIIWWYWFSLSRWLNNEYWLNIILKMKAKYLFLKKNIYSLKKLDWPFVGYWLSVIGLVPPK